MTDLDSFDAAEANTLELTVPDGTTYEFDSDHLPYLKSVFGDLELDDAEIPDIEWSADNFRERAGDDE